MSKIYGYLGGSYTLYAKIKLREPEIDLASLWRARLQLDFDFEEELADQWQDACLRRDGDEVEVYEAGLVRASIHQDLEDFVDWLMSLGRSGSARLRYADRREHRGLHWKVTGKGTQKQGWTGKKSVSASERKASAAWRTVAMRQDAGRRRGMVLQAQVVQWARAPMTLAIHGANPASVSRAVEDAARALGPEHELCPLRAPADRDMEDPTKRWIIHELADLDDSTQLWLLRALEERTAPPFLAFTVRIDDIRSDLWFRLGLVCVDLERFPA